MTLLENMIRNILFDMGGVIFRQTTKEAVRRFAEAGIDTEKYMGEHGQKGFFLDIETGRIDTDEFCRRMAEESHRERVTYEEAEYCWLGFVGEVRSEYLDCLTRLKESYHLCLLTNTNPFIMNYMRSSRFCAEGKSISDYFHKLYCSYEMQLYKPHPDFFRHVLEAEGMNADECLFIDDSIKNVRGAEAVGIHGLHVQQNEDWTPLLSCLVV